MMTPQTHTTRFARTLILLLSALGFSGCASAPARPAELPETLLPATFELSLTVINPDRNTSEHWDRPARFVVESDGWLRAGTGTGATRETLPPRTRRLTHAQRLHLWELTQATGLLTPGCPVRIASGNGSIPPIAQPLLLITARTDSELCTGVVSIDSALAEPYLPLITTLAEWGWVRREPGG